MVARVGDGRWYTAGDYTVVRWHNNGCDWAQKWPLFVTALLSGGAMMVVIPAQKWPLGKGWYCS